jgi:hypothetical protein
MRERSASANARRMRAEVATVARRAMLLPPRVGESTSVDGIEAKLVDQAERRLPERVAPISV